MSAVENIHLGHSVVAVDTRYNADTTAERGRSSAPSTRGGGWSRVGASKNGQMEVPGPSNYTRFTEDLRTSPQSSTATE
jgi:hypothetical protein